jgi:hypothetical protein
MPFQIVNQGDLLRIQPSGAITRHCLGFALGEVIAAEDAMETILNRVTDLTQVESFDISFEALWSLVQLRRTTVFKNAFKSAIVAERGIEVGFARMFQMLNDNPQIEIEVFGTAEAALAWASPK